MALPQDVIIDWHVTSFDPNEHLTEATAFWTEMAKTFEPSRVEPTDKRWYRKCHGACPIHRRPRSRQWSRSCQRSGSS